MIHAFDGESFERWYINQEPRKRYLSSLVFFLPQVVHDCECSINE